MGRMSQNRRKPSITRRLPSRYYRNRMIHTLVHLSDLHIGRRSEDAKVLHTAVTTIIDSKIDHVVITGDVTHHGREPEYNEFLRLVEPIANRITVVPGNHDRLGHNIASQIQQTRVEIDSRPGLYMIKLDSTAPHNRILAYCHGEISHDDIDTIQKALTLAPPNTLSVILLHHHVYPLPGDDLWDKFVSLIGTSWASELQHGFHLTDGVMGNCDLILHGHRHAASEATIDYPNRQLRIVNAGSSTASGKSTVFYHNDGKLVGTSFIEFGSKRYQQPIYTELMEAV